MLLKKKIYPLSLLLALSTCLPMTVNSQDTFSLNDLIRQTLDANYQIQIYRNQEDIAANNNTLGNAGFLPSVDITGEQSISIASSRSEFLTGDSLSGTNARSTAMNAMAELNWTIFDGFRMFARKDRFEYLQQLSANDTKYFIEQTISDVAKAYYQLIREKQLLNHYEQSLFVSRYRLKLEAQKRKIGSGNALLHNQAIVDHHTDSSLYIHQQTVVQNLIVRINRMVNRELETAVDPAQSDIMIQKLQAKDTLIERAIQHNQDLKRAHLRELLAETDLRIEKGNRYPEISLFGNYAYSRQTSELGFVESGQNYGPQFGVRVRFNLYNGNQQNIRIKNTRIEQENTSLETKDIKQDIKATLIERINDHRSQRQQLALTKKSLEAAEESLNIAQKQLETGAIDGFDFRQTQLALLQVKNRLTELKYNIKTLEIDILRISGLLADDMLNY